jgi:hypothetical protein
MRRGAETVQADHARVARERVAAIADQPGAKERRRFGVAITLGNRQAEALVGEHVLGVAAVDAAAGEAGSLAEVLAAAPAILAFAAGPAEPRNADTVAGFEAISGIQYGTHDLVAGRHREAAVRQLAIDEMQVGAADAASAHAQQNVPGPDSWVGYLNDFQRTISDRARGAEDCGFHRKENAVAMMPELQGSRHAGGLQPYRYDSDGPSRTKVWRRDAGTTESIPV